MSEQIASQSEESQNEPNEKVSAAFEAFGIMDDDTPPTPGKQKQQEDDDSDGGEPPAKAEQPEPKKIKVKVDKEEREFDVSDDKIPEYVQKAYALDKERQRKSELEKNLERAAKLAGFDKSEEYLASLDRLEQEAQKKQQDQFKELRQQLREEAEYNGLDGDKVDAWLDAHPLLQEANKAIQERQQAEEQRKQQTFQEQWDSKWNELYKAYPDLEETSSVFEQGGVPDWYTPEMQARVERGYDPIDAYELAHKSTIIERNKQMAKQQAIKEQRLGMRAQVETEANADVEADVNPRIAGAFALFGLNPGAAKKYAKK